MGYYTNYQIKIVCDPDEILLLTDGSNAKTKLESLLNDDDFNYKNEFHFCEDYLAFTADDSIKWYSHEDDMRSISLKMQDILLELRGEGENHEDKWKKYFLNGKMQVCYAIIVEPTFPEFDATLLK